MLAQDVHDAPYTEGAATDGAFNMGVASAIFCRAASRVNEDRMGN